MHKLIVVLIAAAGLHCTGLLPARESPPPGPPVGRHQSCLANSCQEGLTCVPYDDTAGHRATCEIPCGAGCPDGESCGTITSPIFGPGPRNVCID